MISKFIIMYVCMYASVCMHFPWDKYDSHHIISQSSYLYQRILGVLSQTIQHMKARE